MRVNNYKRLKMNILKLYILMNHFIKKYKIFFNKIILKKKSLIFFYESGLYSIIMTAKTKYAGEFQDWVTSEVLPSIRKTGAYNISNYDNENLDKYNGKDCIYILHIKDNLYKFGKSSHLKERLYKHKIALNYLSIVNIYICNNMNIVTNIENEIKQLIKNYGINARYNNQIEIFKLTTNISFDIIINDINKLVNNNNNPSIDNIKINTLCNNITSLELDNDYFKKSKLLELKNIGIIEKTKQLETEKNIKLEEEKTLIKIKNIFFIFINPI